MDGIKYVQKNRLMVASETDNENAPLQAEGSNAIVTENEIWFDPPIPDFSDLEEHVNDFNESRGTCEERDFDESLVSSIQAYDYTSKYRNQYGFVCGVISYRTSQYLWPSESFSWSDLGKYFYEGDERFWYWQDSKLNSNAHYPATNRSSGDMYPEVIGGYLATNSMGPSGDYSMSDISSQGNALQLLSAEGWMKLRFYNSSKILGPGQLLVNSWNGRPWLSSTLGPFVMFTPNFTGNKGVLPVGLVMLRDLVVKNSGRNLNNFGEYGFVIIMPIFIEPSQVIHGFSLGKEIFVVGSGLKAEVFFATTTDLHSDKSCMLSQANMGDGSESLTDTNLDVLFSGKNGELRLANGRSSETDEIINCTNIYHSVVDFSVPGACNGVFYFNNNLTYDMGVKYLIFGMRPYDINGNGKEYPPNENPYGTDTSYLGNYALIDISDKKFYLL